MAPSFSGVWKLQTKYQYNSAFPIDPNFLPRALIAGLSVASNVIDFVTIDSAGDAKDFGDLSVARAEMGASSSSTRAVFGGGKSLSVAKHDTMDFVTIATSGNATDFGNLTDGRNTPAACGNETRGVWGGGEGSTNPTNIIDYITIASTGNATDFGDLSVARKTYGQAAASPTRGVWLGGQGSNSLTVYNTIDYITIGSTGNATDFGDLSATSRLGSACSSNTRAVHHMGIGGGSTVNTLEYITIGSTGNSTDFGDLYAAFATGSTSNSTKGIFFGGNGGSDNIHQITIASTGNSTDFGDCTSSSVEDAVGTSGEHGGLS